jgi:hypothetical protein
VARACCRIVLIGLTSTQTHLSDTPSFQKLKAAWTSGSPNSRDSAAANGRSNRCCAGFAGARSRGRIHVRSFWRLGLRRCRSRILIAFVVAYGSNPQTLNVPRDTMLVAVLIGSLAQIPVLFGAAAWSDRHGRRGIYMLGAVLGGIWRSAVSAIDPVNRPITPICGGRRFCR